MMLTKPFKESMKYLSLNKGLLNKLRRVVLHSHNKKFCGILFRNEIELEY